MHCSGYTHSDQMIAKCILTWIVLSVWVKAQSMNYVCVDLDFSAGISFNDYISSKENLMGYIETEFGMAAADTVLVDFITSEADRATAPTTASIKLHLHIPDNEPDVEARRTQIVGFLDTKFPIPAINHFSGATGDIQKGTVYANGETYTLPMPTGEVYTAKLEAKTVDVVNYNKEKNVEIRAALADYLSRQHLKAMPMGKIVLNTVPYQEPGDAVANFNFQLYLEISTDTNAGDQGQIMYSLSKYFQGAGGGKAGDYLVTTMLPSGSTDTSPFEAYFELSHYYPESLKQFFMPPHYHIRTKVDFKSTMTFNQLKSSYELFHDHVQTTVSHPSHLIQLDSVAVSSNAKDTAGQIEGIVNYYFVEFDSSARTSSMNALSTALDNNFPIASNTISNWPNADPITLETNDVNGHDFTPTGDGRSYHLAKLKILQPQKGVFDAFDVADFKLSLLTKLSVTVSGVAMADIMFDKSTYPAIQTGNGAAGTNFKVTIYKTGNANDAQDTSFTTLLNGWDYAQEKTWGQDITTSVQSPPDANNPEPNSLFLFLYNDPISPATPPAALPGRNIIVDLSISSSISYDTFTAGVGTLQNNIATQLSIPNNLVKLEDYDNTNHVPANDGAATAKFRVYIPDGEVPEANTNFQTLLQSYFPKPGNAVFGSTVTDSIQLSSVKLDGNNPTQTPDVRSMVHVQLKINKIHAYEVVDDLLSIRLRLKMVQVLTDAGTTGISMNDIQVEPIKSVYTQDNYAVLLNSVLRVDQLSQLGSVFSGMTETNQRSYGNSVVGGISIKRKGVAVTTTQIDTVLEPTLKEFDPAAAGTAATSNYDPDLLLPTLQTAFVVPTAATHQVSVARSTCSTGTFCVHVNWESTTGDEFELLNFETVHAVSSPFTSGGDAPLVSGDTSKWTLEPTSGTMDKLDVLFTLQKKGTTNKLAVRAIAKKLTPNASHNAIGQATSSLASVSFDGNHVVQYTSEFFQENQLDFNVKITAGAGTTTHAPFSNPNGNTANT